MVKHVGNTTGVVIAPSDEAGSTTLHRLEFLFCGLCVWIVAPLNVSIPLNVSTPLNVSKTSTLNVSIPLNESNQR